MCFTSSHVDCHGSVTACQQHRGVKVMRWFRVSHAASVVSEIPLKGPKVLTEVFCERALKSWCERLWVMHSFRKSLIPSWFVFFRPQEIVTGVVFLLMVLLWLTRAPGFIPGWASLFSQWVTFFYCILFCMPCYYMWLLLLFTHIWVDSRLLFLLEQSDWLHYRCHRGPGSGPPLLHRPCTRT